MKKYAVEKDPRWMTVEEVCKYFAYTDRNSLYRLRAKDRRFRKVRVKKEGHENRYFRGDIMKFKKNKKVYV